MNSDMADSPEYFDMLKSREIDRVKSAVVACLRNLYQPSAWELLKLIRKSDGEESLFHMEEAISSLSSDSGPSRISGSIREAPIKSELPSLRQAGRAAAGVQQAAFLTARRPERGRRRGRRRHRGRFVVIAYSACSFPPYWILHKLPGVLAEQSFFVQWISATKSPYFFNRKGVRA